MSWQNQIIEIHTAVTEAVSHDLHIQSDRYFVWGERSRDDLILDGIHAEKVILGYTDLFTKLEFDPWRNEIEKQFDSAGIAWGLNSVQYEEKTGFTHFEWYWEIVNDGNS